MLEINSLSIGYKNKLVKENLNFTFVDGFIYGIVGESGCGKSTFANAIVGINKPLGGSIKLDGKDLYLNNKYQKEFYSQIHLIPQNPYLSIDRTHTIKFLLHEVCHVYHLFKDLSSEKEKIKSLLNNVGLNEEILKRKPDNLSGGEVQRILIVEALLLNAKIIIFDESLSMLDQINKMQIIDLCKKIIKEYNNIIILISHERSLVSNISKKVCDFNETIN